MDGEPARIVDVLRRTKASGKGIIGMKIVGEGRLRDRVDESLRFVLGLDCVDCFTIGAADRVELADLIKRIPANSPPPGRRRRVRDSLHRTIGRRRRNL